MNLFSKLSRLERACRGRQCPRCAGELAVLVVEEGSKELRGRPARCPDCGAPPAPRRLIVVPRGSGNPYFDSPLAAAGFKTKR